MGTGVTFRPSSPDAARQLSLKSYIKRTSLFFQNCIENNILVFGQALDLLVPVS
jgi:hypothetical protein